MPLTTNRATDVGRGGSFHFQTRLPSRSLARFEISQRSRPQTTPVSRSYAISSQRYEVRNRRNVGVSRLPPVAPPPLDGAVDDSLLVAGLAPQAGEARVGRGRAL